MDYKTLSPLDLQWQTELISVLKKFMNEIHWPSAISLFSLAVWRIAQRRASQMKKRFGQACNIRASVTCIPDVCFLRMCYYSVIWVSLFDSSGWWERKVCKKFDYKKHFSVCMSLSYTDTFLCRFEVCSAWKINLGNYFIKFFAEFAYYAWDVLVAGQRNA